MVEWLTEQRTLWLQLEGSLDLTLGVDQNWISYLTGTHGHSRRARINFQNNFESYALGSECSHLSDNVFKTRQHKVKC